MPAATVVLPATSREAAAAEDSGFGALVPDPVDRQDVARATRVWFDLASHVLDVGIDGPIERLDLHPANRIEELRAGKHAAGGAGQGSDELQLGGCEVE